MDDSMHAALIVLLRNQATQLALLRELYCGSPTTSRSRRKRVILNQAIKSTMDVADCLSELGSRTIGETRTEPPT